MVGSRNYFNRELRSIGIFGGIALLAMGCDDRNAVKVYQAPKELPQQPMDAATPAVNPAIAPANTPTGGAPQWVVPQGWAQLPAQEMRFATFAVDSADPKLNVIVYTFGPASGQLLPNVNRWEQQIGLTPSSADDLPKVVTHIQNNGLEIDNVDLKAPAPAGQTEGVRMLAAIIPTPAQVWFLKFVGPASKVTAHKAEYDSFLKSITINAAAAVATPEPVGPVPAPVTAAGSIPAFSAYSLPAGWVLDPQEKPMRVATFHISDGTQNADVIVSMLPADQFGTPEANVNRWRGQVGLDPVDDASKVARTPVKVGGGDGFVFDFVSADATAADAKQLVVAQVIKDNHAFFFKLIGPAKLVEQQKKSFDSFLQSVQFASNLP